MNGGQYGRTHSVGDEAASREAVRQHQLACGGYGLLGLAVVATAVTAPATFGVFAPAVALLGVMAVIAAAVAARRPVMVPVLVRSDVERAPRD